MTTCCGLSAVSVEKPFCFTNLSSKCKLIVTKTRNFSSGDKTCVGEEIYCLLSEGIIEYSISPWCTEAVVVKDPSNRYKKRFCIISNQSTCTQN